MYRAASGRQSDPRNSVGLGELEQRFKEWFIV